MVERQFSKLRAGVRFSYPAHGTREASVVAGIGESKAGGREAGARCISGTVAEAGSRALVFCEQCGAKCLATRDRKAYSPVLLSRTIMRFDTITGHSVVQFSINAPKPAPCTRNRQHAKYLHRPKTLVAAWHAVRGRVLSAICPCGILRDARQHSTQVIVGNLSSYLQK